MRLLLLFLSTVSIAESIETYSFASKAQQIRYTQLIKDIRCPVCQGQSIGGSNAPLAQDLRRVVRDMLQQNQTDSQIFKFMTDRYGDFVVFEPPVNYQTYILWFAPFLSVLFLITILMRKKNTNQNEFDATKLQQAKDLLDS